MYPGLIAPDTYSMKAGDYLNLKECPMCCGEMVEIPELGYECKNCGEIFTTDDRYEIRLVTREEWIQYLDKIDRQG